VISKPRPGRLTLDLGHKAVAADPPMERRVRFLELPEARIVLQNEEHLVIETPSADRYQPGDLFYAWPAHICPSCALHRELIVIENHRVTGKWKTLARDRELSC
jgi:D-serine deaminase-like pyridoxal phosphate-dependent protein